MSDGAPEWLLPPASHEADAGLAVECPNCMEVLTLDDVRLLCTGMDRNRFALRCTCGRYIPVEVRVGKTTAKPPKWQRQEGNT